MRKDLEKLIKITEPQIVSIWIAHGLVTIGKNAERKYSNCKLTSLGSAKTGISPVILTKEMVKKLRFIFPQGLRGNHNVVYDKLQRFYCEYPDTDWEDILKAAAKWVNDKNDYCGNVNNFVYLKKDGTEESRLEQYLELLETDVQSSEGRHDKIL